MWSFRHSSVEFRLASILTVFQRRRAGSTLIIIGTCLLLGLPALIDLVKDPTRRPLLCFGANFDAKSGIRCAAALLFLTFARLDHAAFAIFPLCYWCIEAISDKRRRPFARAASATFAGVLLLFLLCNKLYAGLALPVSGTAKSTFPIPRSEVMTGLVNYFSNLLRPQSLLEVSRYTPNVISLIVTLLYLGIVVRPRAVRRGLALELRPFATKLEYHKTYADFNLTGAPRVRQVLHGQIPNILEVDDGIVGYGLGVPVMASGSALDREGSEALQKGHLLQLALDRGFSAVATLFYGTHNLTTASTPQEAAQWVRSMFEIPQGYHANVLYGDSDLRWLLLRQTEPFTSANVAVRQSERHFFACSHAGFEIRVVIQATVPRRHDKKNTRQIR